eukprot:scaffold20445_cov69-Phaeocystis_antarctica.AAC.1
MLNARANSARAKFHLCALRKNVRAHASLAPPAARDGARARAPRRSHGAACRWHGGAKVAAADAGGRGGEGAAVAPPWRSE